MYLCAAITVLPSALVTPVAPQVPVARLAGSNQILFELSNKYFLGFQTNTFFYFKQILFELQPNTIFANKEQHDRPVGYHGGRETIGGPRPLARRVPRVFLRSGRD